MSRCKEWARWVDPGGRKRLVLVTDGAGWHTSGNLEVPPHYYLSDTRILIGEDKKA